MSPPLVLAANLAANLVALLGAAGGPSPPAPDGAPRPNVLLLVADDLGTDHVGCYGEGADPPPTPVLDALAAQGVRFTSAWGYPACSPTRAVLQSGRYGFRTGVGSSVFESSAGANGPLPLAETTIPEMLDRGHSGYLHAALGKWHIGTSAVGGDLAPNAAGYLHYGGAPSNLYAPDTYFAFRKVVNGVPVQVARYATTDEVDGALWLATHVPEPWFLQVAFHAPHEPFHAPPPHLHTQDLSGAGPPALDPRPYYRASVEALDREIGRLLAGLGDVAERTVVVFVADNGTPREVVVPPHAPDHAKLTLFEGGVRVPMIVAGPPVAQPGATCDALVHVADVFATVAELAGVDLASPAVIPPGVSLDSLSLVPHLADPSAPSQRTHLFAEYFVPNGAGLPPGGVVVTKKAGEPPLCQELLGYGAGPAPHPLLAICGGGFTAGSSTTLAVAAGVASEPVGVFYGLGQNPAPYCDGLLVPYPLAAIQVLKSDAAGIAVLELDGDLVAKLPSFDLYVQALVRDPSAFFGYRLTNAVRLRAAGMDHKAIRDERYKLIAFGNNGPAALYDLAVDPLETNDLLQGGVGALSPPHAQALQALEAALAALLQS